MVDTSWNGADEADYVNYKHVLIENMQEHLLDDMLSRPRFRAMLIRRGWRHD